MAGVSYMKEHLRNVDFGVLITSFCTYLENLNENSRISDVLRIRIRMCQLVETLMSKKDVIGLRQEIRLRNRLLETLISWSSYHQQVFF